MISLVNNSWHFYCIFILYPTEPLHDQIHFQESKLFIYLFILVNLYLTLALA